MSRPCIAVHHLFPVPNTILSVGSVSKIGGILTLNRLVPPSIGENVTRVVACAQNGVPGPEHIAEIDKSLISIRGAVVEEDYSATNEAYDALAELPPGWEFVYGRHEVGVQNLHKNFSKVTGFTNHASNPILGDFSQGTRSVWSRCSALCRH